MKEEIEILDQTEESNSDVECAPYQIPDLNSGSRNRTPIQSPFQQRTRFAVPLVPVSPATPTRRLKTPQINSDSSSESSSSSSSSSKRLNPDDGSVGDELIVLEPS